MQPPQLVVWRDEPNFRGRVRCSPVAPPRPLPCSAVLTRCADAAPRRRPLRSRTRAAGMRRARSRGRSRRATRRSEGRGSQASYAGAKGAALARTTRTPSRTRWGRTERRTRPSRSPGSPTARSRAIWARRRGSARKMRSNRLLPSRPWRASRTWAETDGLMWS